MYTVKYRNSFGTHIFRLSSLKSAIGVAKEFGGIIYDPRGCILVF